MASDGGFSDSGSHDFDFELAVNGRRNNARRLTLGHPKTKGQLSRIVNRVPEVMVKVSGGGKTAQHVRAHLDYITRNGKLDAVTEQGDIVSGKDDVRDLADEWNLEAGANQGKNRQAFNIVLSMPAGTDPQKLFTAARNFAREQFWGKHQYLMVLHTPETDPHKDAPPHPHVHLVVKAEGIEKKKARLYIRKATLEKWRGSFAEQLRAQGVEANATPRDIRGQTKKAKSPAIYFSEKSGKSSVLRSKFEEARQDLTRGESEPKPWETAILNRRRAVVRTFLSAAAELRKEGDIPLATAVERYVEELPRPDTERHQIKRALATHVQQQRAKQGKERELEPGARQKSHPTNDPNKDR
jgi:type IV secretion system T-DNA border endonuclease VirD2